MAPPTASTVKAKPPQYLPTSDLRDFVSQFERYLTLSGIANDGLRLQHLSVALPTNLYKLLNMEMQAEPDGTFAVITERFLLAAGAAPRDAASEQAAFETATLAKDEAVAAFAGRLSLMAINAYPTFNTEVRATLIKRRFINAMAATHPLIYRTLEASKPTTLADAVEVAAIQLRVDATVAAQATTHAASATITAPIEKAPTPAASSTTIVASTSTTAANASETSLADKMNDVLKHLRAIRSGPGRGGFNRPQGNFQRRFQPRYDYTCNHCQRCNHQAGNEGNSDAHETQDRRQSQRLFRPASAPPRNLQCFKCGENHYARDCPNAMWPGHH